MKTFTRSAVATAAAVLFASVAGAQTVPTEAAANDVQLKQIGAYAAWARGYTGLGIKVGIVDTGADLKHKDLSNVILSQGYLAPTISDVNRGHGTAMISLMAGAKNGTGVVGVAYDAKVMAYAGGNYGLLYNSIVSNGIKWNADNGASVINLSLGSAVANTDFSNWYTSPAKGVYIRKTGVNDIYAQKPLLAPIQYATSKGSIVVMAAGNNGGLVPVTPANSVALTDSTGALLLGGRAVAVGAVDSNNVIASYSNRAGHICQTVVAGACADKVQIKDYFLVAPGGLVWGANANNTTQTGLGAREIAQLVGTSASAALVSGGVAVIKQAWPTLKPEQIVQVLLKTATDLGAPGVDEVYGNGLMNLDAATRPLGALTMAKITSTSTTQIAAGPVKLSTTGLTGGVLSKQSLADSSVLKSAQAVDEMGRNFAVNMTAGVETAMQNYSSATVYSNLSKGSINRVDLGSDSLVNAVYASTNMSGVVVGKKFDNVYFGIETGTATEQNAILGSAGSGALSLGNSSTTWTALHVSKDIEGTGTSVFGSIAQGNTQASAAAGSLLTSFSSIATRSVSFGAKQRGVFDNKDNFSFQVAVMPHIISGSAQVTAVTSFAVANVSDEGATATPTVSTERVNLANSYRQYAVSMAYDREVTQYSNVQLSVTMMSDNAGATVKPAVSLGFTQRF